MKKAKRSTKKGFTLIELIVVIAILGILAAVLLPKFSGFTDDARKKSAMSEAKNVYTAMSAYYAENGIYPTDKTKLTNLSSDLIANTKITNSGDELFTYNYKNEGNIILKVSQSGVISGS